MPDLLPLLHKGSDYYDGDLLWTALNAIVQLRNGNLVPDLLPLLQKDSDRKLRGIAVNLIVELRSGSYVPEFLLLLQNSDYSNPI